MFVFITLILAFWQRELGNPNSVTSINLYTNIIYLIIVIILLNWIGQILRKNCQLHDASESQMAKVKGVGRRTQLLGDLRNRRRYWEVKEEVEDRIRRK